MTDRARTHWEGCYLDPRHEECAKANITELQRLAWVGKAVVERVDEEGEMALFRRTCIGCGNTMEKDHTDDCPLAAYLNDA